MNTRASRRSPRNDSNLDPPITRIPIPSAANASMTSRSQGNTGRVWGSRQMQLGTDSTRVSTSASRSRASGVITKRRSLLAKYIGPAPESAPVTPAPPRTSGRPLRLTVKTDSPEADRPAQAVIPLVVTSRKWTSAQICVPSSVPEKLPDLGAPVPKSQSNLDGMTEVSWIPAVARAAVTARSWSGVGRREGSADATRADALAEAEAPALVGTPWQATTKSEAQRRSRRPMRQQIQRWRVRGSRRRRCARKPLAAKIVCSGVNYGRVELRHLRRGDA